MGSAMFCILMVIYIYPTCVGEVITVHPAAGPQGQIETLDPSGQFDHLGQWRAHNSVEVAAFVDDGLAAVKDGSLNAWSGI